MPATCVPSETRRLFPLLLVPYLWPGSLTAVSSVIGLPLGPERCSLFTDGLTPISLCDSSSEGVALALSRLLCPV